MKTALIIGGLVALGALLWWFVSSKRVQIPTGGNTLGRVLGWDGEYHTDPVFGPDVA